MEALLPVTVSDEHDEFFNCCCCLCFLAMGKRSSGPAPSGASGIRAGVAAAVYLRSRAQPRTHTAPDEPTRHVAHVARPFPALARRDGPDGHLVGPSVPNGARLPWPGPPVPDGARLARPQSPFPDGARLPRVGSPLPNGACVPRVGATVPDGARVPRYGDVARPYAGNGPRCPDGAALPRLRAAAAT